MDLLLLLTKVRMKTQSNTESLCYFIYGYYVELSFIDVLQNRDDRIYCGILRN